MNEIKEDTPKVPAEPMLFEFVPCSDIRSFFRKCQPSLEDWIKREYQNNRLSRQSAINYREIIVVSEKFLLKCIERGVDPKDIIAWLDAPD